MSQIYNMFYMGVDAAAGQCVSRGPAYAGPAALRLTLPGGSIHAHIPAA